MSECYVFTAQNIRYFYSVLLLMPPYSAQEHFANARNDVTAAV